MAFQMAKGNWFFRLQIDVPYDGDLNKLFIQICHKFGWYRAKPDGSPDYTQFEGEIPEVKILTLPNPSILESKYPGITDAMRLLQFAAISEGLEQLNLATPEPEQ